MSHMFVEAWGEAWLRHGVLIERQRKPVYEGQKMTAVGQPIVVSPEGVSCDALLTNEDGEEVATSTGQLPTIKPIAPDLNEYPHRPHTGEKVFVPGGGHKAGDRYGSTPFVYTQSIHDDYLNRVRETLPVFTKEKVVHPGYLVKLTMHDADDSYTRETPGVHLE